MARISNPSRPEIQAGTSRLEQVATRLAASYTPEPGEETGDSVRAGYEREAAALTHYWEHLVGELRAVDRRLEELSTLLA